MVKPTTLGMPLHLCGTKMLSTGNRLRHPEKAHRPESAIPRKPAWIRVARAYDAANREQQKMLRHKCISSTCDEAAYPSRSDLGSVLRRNPLARFGARLHQFLPLLDDAKARHPALSATPMTRSSFHAENGFAALQSARLSQTASKELLNG